MPEQLASLQALRGLAAMLVMLFHLTWYGGQPPMFGRSFVAGSAGGVFLFFLLSGFVMVWTYHGDVGQWRRVLRYAVGRVTRIYPLFWIVLLLSIPYARTYTMLVPSGVAAWTSQLMLYGWGPWVVPPAGTLPFELWCYLGFGILLLVGWSGWCVVACVWLAWVFRFQGGFLQAAPMLRSPYLLLFVIGMFAAVLVRAWRPRVPGWVPVGMLLTLGVILAIEGQAMALGVYRQGPLALVEVGLLLAVVWHELAYQPRYPWGVRLLGEASYSIYLTHYYVIWWANGRLMQWEAEGWFPPYLQLEGTGRGVLVVIVVLAVGVGTWWLIERPLLWGRAWILRRCPT